MEWRRSAEQGTEYFMAKWIAVEKARAGLRHATVCPNVMGRTKERIVQSKRARAGSLALMNSHKSEKNLNVLLVVGYGKKKVVLGGIDTVNSTIKVINAVGKAAAISRRYGKFEKLPVPELASKAVVTQTHMFNFRTGTFLGCPFVMSRFICHKMAS